MTLMISKFRYLLPCALAVLVAGCAPLTVPPKAEYPVGRARLVLPPGAWQDLGSTDEARATLQTRAVATWLGFRSGPVTARSSRM
jgi:hypothetical protein